MASNPAGDNACTNPPYAGFDNWNGLNGGSGFAAWQVSPPVNGGNAGAFIGDSDGNGGGGGPGINCRGGDA